MLKTVPGLAVKLLNIIKFHLKDKFDLILVFIFTLILSTGFFYYSKIAEKLNLVTAQGSTAQTQLLDTKSQLSSVSAELDKLKGQDQIKVNQDLQSQINNIHNTYSKSAQTYETLQDFKASSTKKWLDFDTQYAKALKQLSDKDFNGANSTLDDLGKKIQTEKDKVTAAIAAAAPIANAPANNSAPGSGYSRQSVQTDVGSFVVDIIAADLNSTKVIIDTASDSDCSNNCPAMPLGDYASRSGAYAAMNGSFFCPPEYPSCAGKTNSFDTLLMNKNKKYFNSDNNVYSVVPAVIFSSGNARFVNQSQEWGRDTSPDGVIANYPMLVYSNNIVFTSSDDPKFGAKGNRSFVAHKGSTVFIGYVHGATMSDSAHVMQTLGMTDALNMDEGGSSALWFGGKYLVGPGRNIPNAILFVKR